MLFEKVFLFFSLLHLTNSHLQINLHLTDWEIEDNNLQHDCLQVPVHFVNESDSRQIISYCMSEWPSTFKIKENNHDQKFTFEQLSKQNITSQQLYIWSAPIDLIEKYQFYLNQPSKSKNTILAKEIFHNCTLPYFGSKCQYVLQDYKSYHLSLEDIVYDYYQYNRYKPTLLTCYIHLECNRGPFPACLDWTEICDGKVDCIYDGNDEEHCWKIESQQYQDDIYKRYYQKCIFEPFFREDIFFLYCDVELDLEFYLHPMGKPPLTLEPKSEYEDISCVKHNLIMPRGRCLTSSCNAYRDDLLTQAIFSIKPNSITDECWIALKCFMNEPIRGDPVCSVLLKSGIIHKIINKTCPNITYVPAMPILLGHIYVAYDKNILLYQSGIFQSAPTYFCYNDQFLYIPDDNEKIILSDNKTCYFYSIEKFSLYSPFGWIASYIFGIYYWLQRYAMRIDKNFQLVDKSNMYKCMNSSKYISKYQLFDRIHDCYHADDEIVLNGMCSTEKNENYFKCVTTDVCIPIHFVHDQLCDCKVDHLDICDDEYHYTPEIDTIVSFRTICDGYINRSPKLIEDENDTDETNCEQWPLIHVYNRCDGYWHQLDGSDEINCDPSPLLNCPANNHICVSPKTNKLMCLSIEKANDGIVDCLGAADEPILCRRGLYLFSHALFYCNQSDSDNCAQVYTICDTYPMCKNEEDEQACSSGNLFVFMRSEGICTFNYESLGSDEEKVLCRRFSYDYRRTRSYFTVDQWQNLIKRHSKQRNSTDEILPHMEYYQQRCHRGLDLQVWLDKEKNITKNICLCPPSSYGNICQYQNQRVSLTLEFRTTSDSVQTPFTIIVLLIDNTNERIIHSYEQFTYLSVKHCRRRFSIYLLYSTKPKDETKDYSIQIDIYEKKSLDYRASFIKALNFSFLPVHRIALEINIPPTVADVDHCSDIQCLHGKCQKYVNTRNNQTFCQCKSGWSGRSCSIPYTSNCLSDLLSIGKLANNRSLCLCPINKIGPRCLIDDMTCQNDQDKTCFNNGECVSIDEYKTLNKKFYCICPKGFIGDQCEINSTKLIITFDKNISLPSSSIRIHFIEAKLDAPHVRTTTFKTIFSGESSITVYWSLPFHIAFVDLLNKTYYLIHMQTIYNQSLVIKKTFHSSDRCLHVNEFFNESIANSSLIRRIKYYHLPCQTNLFQLQCFYDEIHFCFCQQINQERVANCFEFDHNMSLYCSDQSVCENGGRCFQEQTLCSRISICECPICYYGARCQLSASGFSLSLDAILGYHIRPNLNISHQPLAVLISLILTVMITLLGFVNGILSFITFRNKTTRESGCGIYLFTSSIIILMTMIIFLLKFLILLLSQMRLITNELFLKMQCYSIDFLLRFSLTMDQWLTAFVSIERVFVVIKGINFNKKKFKLIAKSIIAALILMGILTNIHDPIYRNLFQENDDDDKKRFWCIVKYPSAIRIINLIINIIHFIVPFIINLISAIIIIIMSTRQQVAVKKKQKYREILKKQIHQHKNLLIGPCVLIVFGIPRLIILFASGCMKTPSDSWLFLMGYFISLIPSLSTFILFVLPSTTYKQAFRQVISRYRNMIKRGS